MKDSSKYEKQVEKREYGPYSVITWGVLDSPAYLKLSHPARALLIELMRQYGGKNNGKLLLSMRHLRTRGWNSSDVVARAKTELLNSRLIYQTVMGCRPNKAGWYALTWYSLDDIKGFDAGAVEGFSRSMYVVFDPPVPATDRQDLFDRAREYGKKSPGKVSPINPSDGLDGVILNPSGGLDDTCIDPSNGPIDDPETPPASPPDGNHIGCSMYRYPTSVSACSQSPGQHDDDGVYKRLTENDGKFFTSLLDWHPTAFDDAPLQTSEDSAMEQPPQATAFTSRLKGMKGLTSTTGDSDSTEDEAGEPIDESWCEVAKDEEVSAWAD